MWIRRKHDAIDCLQRDSGIGSRGIDADCLYHSRGSVPTGIKREVHGLVQRRVLYLQHSRTSTRRNDLRTLRLGLDFFHQPPDRYSGNLSYGCCLERKQALCETIHRLGRCCYVQYLYRLSFTGAGSKRGLANHYRLVQSKRALSCFVYMDRNEGERTDATASSI